MRSSTAASCINTSDSDSNRLVFNKGNVCFGLGGQADSLFLFLLLTLPGRFT